MGTTFDDQVPSARDFYHPVHDLVVAACRTLRDEGRATWSWPDVVEAAERLRPGIVRRHLEVAPDFLERIGEGAFGGLNAMPLRVAGERVRTLSMLRRQLELLDASAAAIRQRGEAEPARVLQETLAALREADSVTADARRAITRGSSVELGRAVLEILRRGGERIVFDLGAFWRYEPESGLWSQIHQSAVEQATHTLDGLLYGEGDEIVLHQHTIRSAISTAAAQAARPGWLSGADGQRRAADGPPAGLCVQNGFVTVDAGGVHLEPHAPSHRVIAALPFAYATAAPAPRWRRFIAEVFAGDADGEEKAAVLQEFTGASLLGLAPRYGRAVLLVGEGRNGKNVAIDTIRRLFPAGSVTAVPPQALDDKNSASDYARARLSTALLNCVSEMPGAEILSSEAFKSAVTGDFMEGREPGRSRFGFCPRAGWLLAANRLPPFTDHSAGFLRRWILLEFRQTFDGARDNPHLREELEQAELPGIAAWALEGAVRLLRRQRYAVPASSAAALDRWRDRADPVRQYASERLIASDGAPIAGGALYAHFRNWSLENGYRLMSNATFAERLEGAGFIKRRAASGNFWEVEVTP
jgi:P4 family phage/plasmid primase-like protien